MLFFFLILRWDGIVTLRVSREKGGREGLSFYHYMDGRDVYACTVCMSVFISFIGFFLPLPSSRKEYYIHTYTHIY